MSAPSLRPQALHPDTRLAHAGAVVDPSTRAVVASPVFATTFERGADGGYPGGHVYSRTSNPTRALLEAALADLEEGASAAAFASGLAACHAVLAPLAPGSRVLIPTDVYHGLRGLLRDVLGHLRVEAVAMDDDGALVSALGRDATALVWLETPSNPLLRVTDLAAAIGAAHAAGARVAVDSTWPTPLLTRPLALGADYAVHSLTKAIAGHSDVLGGAVIARTEALMAPVRAVQASAGGVLDPFSAWLTLRGMRTLALRMARASATAAALADLLDGHPRVSAVHYPGLASHPGHAVAARQMRLGQTPCFGAMLSVEVAGDAADPSGEAAARRVVNALRVFRQATSLGGTESLAEHRASVEGPDTQTPRGLLRLSIGIEHADDLAADLRAALAGSALA